MMVNQSEHAVRDTFPTIFLNQSSSLTPDVLVEDDVCSSVSAKWGDTPCMPSKLYAERCSLKILER